MPQRIDGDTSTHIEIFAPLSVPYFTALTALKDDGRTSIGVEGIASVASKRVGHVFGCRFVGVSGREIKMTANGLHLC
jgi:hypothetical protein